MSFDAISAKLDSMRSHPAIAQLRQKFCYQLAFVLTDGFTQCEQISLEMDEGSLLKLFYENIKKLDEVQTDSFFFEAFYFYLQKEYNKCKDNIHKLCHVQWKQDILKEDRVLDYLLVPFQNALDEIWDFIMDEVNSMRCEEGIPEFCEVLSLYYRSRDNDVIIEGLLAFMRSFRTIVLQMNCLDIHIIIWQCGIMRSLVLKECSRNIISFSKTFTGC